MMCTVVIIYDMVCSEVIRSDMVCSVVMVCSQVLRYDMFCSVIMIFLFHCKHVAASSSKFVSPLLGDSSLAGIHKYPIGGYIYFKPIFQTDVFFQCSQIRFISI